MCFRVHTCCTLHTLLSFRMHIRLHHYQTAHCNCYPGHFITTLHSHHTQTAPSHIYMCTLLIWASYEHSVSNYALIITIYYILSITTSYNTNVPYRELRRVHKIRVRFQELRTHAWRRNILNNSEIPTDGVCYMHIIISELEVSCA